MFILISSMVKGLASGSGKQGIVPAKTGKGIDLVDVVAFIVTAAFIVTMCLII